jgi:hypothetical protein
MNNLLHKIIELYNTRIYRISFFAALLILLFMLAFRCLLIFTYNPEIGGIDNNFVYAIIRSIAGYDIYPDPTQFPYAANLYSPLYFNVCSSIGKLLNINIEDPINVYRLCRGVSLCNDIITCFLFYRIIIRTINVKKEVAILVTSLFACLLCYLGYTFSRVDSLFLLFYAATFYILLASSIKNNILKFILLALLTTACIFSKQNGIILPLLVAIWIFLNDSPKRSFIYLVLFLLFFSAFLYYYVYAAGYSHFTSHTIEALKNKISPSWFYGAIFKRFADSLILVPLYISVCIALIYFSKGALKERSLGVIFLIQSLFSILASLKFGSTAGYFNESYFIGLILITHYIASLDIKTTGLFSQRLTTWVLPLFVFFSTFVLIQGCLFFIQKQEAKKEVYDNQLSIRNYLAPKLDSSYVFNLGNQNGDFFKNIFYKQAVVPNYDAVSCCTLPDKTFDYSNLLNDLRTGKIGWLIMPEKEITTRQWGVDLNFFKINTIINGHVIYKFQQQ